MLVFDATPLIYLAKADRLKELEKLDQELIIPEKVYDEVVETGKEKGEADAEKIERLVKKGIFKTEASNNRLNVENNFLSQADIEVLDIAEENDAIAVMDEEYGRNIAEVKDIQTRGTAYLVLKLLKKEIISGEEAEKTLDKMIDEGWYCSTDLYKDILNKIEEIS